MASNPEFSSQSLLLPASAPIGFPHLLVSPESIEDSEDMTAIRLADGVVTFLSNWRQDALRALLDLNRGKFEYVLERPGGLSIFIARFGQSIQVGLHSDGWSEGVTTLKYLLSTTGEWKPVFAYKGSISYDPTEIDVFGHEFAMDLIRGKAWASTGMGHKVLWTKRPAEEGYTTSYDGAQQEYYGLPEGWEEMDDIELEKRRKERWEERPFDDQDAWPFELLKKTEC